MGRILLYGGLKFNAVFFKAVFVAAMLRDSVSPRILNFYSDLKYKTLLYF